MGSIASRDPAISMGKSVVFMPRKVARPDERAEDQKRIDKNFSVFV